MLRRSCQSCDISASSQMPLWCIYDAEVNVMEVSAWQLDNCFLKQLMFGKDPAHVLLCFVWDWQLLSNQWPSGAWPQTWWPSTPFWVLVTELDRFVVAPSLSTAALKQHTWAYCITCGHVCVRFMPFSGDWQRSIEVLMDLKFATLEPARGSV